MTKSEYDKCLSSVRFVTGFKYDYQAYKRFAFKVAPNLYCDCNLNVTSRDRYSLLTHNEVLSVYK